MQLKQYPSSPPRSPGSHSPTELFKMLGQLQIQVLWGKRFTGVLCFWLMWRSCTAACSISSDSYSLRGAGSTELLCPHEGAVLQLPLIGKRRATPVPLLWAELLGGIIGSRQVFTIWFPILSFFLPVKSVSKYPELYNKSFFSVLTFLSTNWKKVSLPVKLNILLKDFQCAVKSNGFAWNNSEF